MSWLNPTPEEAYEYYTYNKNRYSNAASQKASSKRNQTIFTTQKNNEQSKLNTLNSQRINLEKRLSGIESIIKMLEGTGGWRSTNIPEAILKVNNTLNKADTALRNSIKLDGNSMTSLETVFNVPSIDGEHHSSVALQAYKSEYNKLTQQINNLKTSINSLSTSISVLNGKINSCINAQNEYQKIMNSSAYEMNHFRKYMY